MTIAITPEHGYVILAASGTFLLNVWQMMKIGGKRKELGIAVRLEGIFCTYYGKNQFIKPFIYFTVPGNVFRETPRIQLLPTCSPKYLGIYSILFGLSFNRWPSSSFICSWSWWNLLGLKAKLYIPSTYYKHLKEAAQHSHLGR